MKTIALLSIIASASFSTALAQIEAPASFRDIDTASVPWKFAEPAERTARGDWWRIYDDPALDELESRALVANQDLHAAAARVEQARATAGLARSNYWPEVVANGSVSRDRASRTSDNVLPNADTTTYRAPLFASWELDLFGRVRRLNESARADAEASAAAFESVRLALTSDVAAGYFSLRAIDRELVIVRDTVTLRRGALDLINSRVKIGTAGELDAVRAAAELATAEAETAALATRRASWQNALAVLVGASAPDFNLPGSMTPLAAPPVVPPGLPASLLERRPDVAAAERTLAAANARIGVAKAAFFPAISLTGNAGFVSGDIDRLFSAGSRVWSIGPSLYLPIFNGGRNRANLERSRAAFDESVANFQQRVLVAFREVQDALTATKLLAEQSAAQERALAAAQRAAALAQVRYDAGYVSYLDVIDAQRTALATERASAQLAAVRLNTSVALIKALGGGWHAAYALPVVAQR